MSSNRPVYSGVPSGGSTGKLSRKRCGSWFALARAGLWFGAMFRHLHRVQREPALPVLLANAQVRLRKARRLPLSVRLVGRALVTGRGALVFGKGAVVRGTVTPVEFVVREGARLTVGDGTFINYGTTITAYERVVIGRGCHIGHYCSISDNDEHTVGDLLKVPPSQPVVLEDRVWLGMRTIVLKGVHIGHDAVIGAGSVVVSDIPPRSIAVGSPARVIRQF